MSVIKALAQLLYAANDFAPEDDPDRYDAWRALVMSARHEFDDLRAEVRRLTEELDEARKEHRWAEEHCDELKAERDAAREALRAVEAHHAGMCEAAWRPLTNSTTLRIVKAGLAGCSHLPGDVCGKCQPTIPVCARHPAQPLRRFGPLFRCSVCGEPGTLMQAALGGEEGAGTP
jgi:predicted  nucleic acid-binding Zn-ribbon protein